MINCPHLRLINSRSWRRLGGVRLPQMDWLGLSLDALT
jgi:hypothetical protein